ncbi:uncharacterized protein TNCV_4583961 [Trichonephila clavipes]|nr:uncharacterized protein TNCV_4583961 [Trichonephila clavipes]
MQDQKCFLGEERQLPVLATVLAKEPHFANRQNASKMKHYTNAELADVHLEFGASICNGQATQWFHPTFPNQTPSQAFFTCLYQRLSGSGSFIVDTQESKRRDEVEKLAYQLNEDADRTERPIRRLSKVMYGSTCTDMQVDVMGECLSSIKHVVGEQLSGGSVAVVHEEPHPQMTGILSYRPEETGGRQWEKSLDTRHRRLDDRYRVLPWPEDCHGGGLFARRPVRCVPLTPAHRRRRSLWCREHRNWRDNEWGRVLFTDESRFSLSSDSHRILIWREQEAAIIPRTSLKGTGAMGLQFLFMDDDASCHRTVAAEQLLESRRLAARTLPPVTILELRLALQDEWAAMPQQLIDTLILSMGRRCETCLAVRGDHIPY